MLAFIFLFFFCNKLFMSSFATLDYEWNAATEEIRRIKQKAGGRTNAVDWSAVCRAYTPFLLRLQDTLVLGKGKRYFAETKEEIRDYLDKTVRSEIEDSIPFPAYARAEIPSGLFAGSAILGILLDIRDVKTPVRVSYADVKQHDILSYYLSIHYRHVDMWFRQIKPTEPEIDRQNIKAVSFNFNDKDFVAMFDLRQLPNPEDPFFVYMQMEDLRRLGVESPPEPEFSEITLKERGFGINLEGE